MGDLFTTRGHIELLNQAITSHNFLKLPTQKNFFVTKFEYECIVWVRMFGVVSLSITAPLKQSWVRHHIHPCAVTRFNTSARRLDYRILSMCFIEIHSKTSPPPPANNPPAYQSQYISRLIDGSSWGKY